MFCFSAYVDNIKNKNKKIRNKINQKVQTVCRKWWGHASICGYVRTVIWRRSELFAPLKDRRHTSSTFLILQEVSNYFLQLLNVFSSVYHQSSVSATTTKSNFKKSNSLEKHLLPSVLKRYNDKPGHVQSVIQ